MLSRRTFEVGFLQLQDWILGNFFNSSGCVSVMSDVGIPQCGEWCVLMRESSGYLCQVVSIWDNEIDVYVDVYIYLRLDWQNDMLGKWDYEVWHVLEDGDVWQAWEHDVAVSKLGRAPMPGEVISI